LASTVYYHKYPHFVNDFVRFAAFSTRRAFALDGAAGVHCRVAAVSRAKIVVTYSRVDKQNSAKLLTNCK